MNNNIQEQQPPNNGSGYYFPLSYLPKIFSSISSIPSFLPFSFINYEKPQVEQSINHYQKNFTSETLTTYMDNVLTKQNKIIIQQNYLFQNIPAFLQLIATIMVEAYRCKQKIFVQLDYLFKSYLLFYLNSCVFIGSVDLVDKFFLNEALQNPILIIMTEKIWKVLSSIVNRKLFLFENQNDDQFFNEVSQSFMFRPEFSEQLFLLITNKSNHITLDCLNQFHENLVLNDINSEINAGSIAFNFYGGKGFKIKQKDFKSSFQSTIALINNYFQKSNIIVNFIKRNLQTQFNLRDDELLENYLKLMGNFQQTNLNGFLDNLGDSIFSENDDLDKKLFIGKVKAFHTSNNSTIVFSLFEIIKTELDLIQSDEFSSFFYSQEEIKLSNEEKDIESNYYLKTIDKLLNKCVYNGEEKCNCKQCLWYEII